jgi:hypothetical protein
MREVLLHLPGFASGNQRQSSSVRRPYPLEGVLVFVSGISVQNRWLEVPGGRSDDDHVGSFIARRVRL